MNRYTPNRITDYVLRLTQKVDITDSVLFKALDIAQELEERHLFFMSGKSSSGLAAGVTYAASLMTDCSLIQTDFVDAICESGICKVGAVTVRNQFRDIVRELGIEELVKPNLRHGQRLWEAQHEFNRIHIEEEAQ